MRAPWTPRLPPIAIGLSVAVLLLAGCQSSDRDEPSPTSSTPSSSTTVSESPSTPTDGEPDNTEGVEASARPGQAAVPAASPVSCPAGTVTVSSAHQLTAALEQAKAGDVIRLQPGTYSGAFSALAKGTQQQPIWLCGDRSAVLAGDGPDGKYVLHLENADYWRLVGFTVRNGQKGVMLDGVTHSVVQGLSISQIGDEALHLRRNSTDNLVLDNDISRTGLRKEKFGEGIYVGSSVNNWCELTGCKPDRSDRNMIAGNTISATTAENVDIKEGTTSGQLRDNVLDGGTVVEDSVVDIKGTAWLVAGNEVRHPPLDGFQTHEIEPRWGARILFEDNTVVGPPRDTGEAAHAIALRPDRDSTVRCSNRAQQMTLSTIECAGS